MAGKILSPFLLSSARDPESGLKKRVSAANVIKNRSLNPTRVEASQLILMTV